MSVQRYISTSFWDDEWIQTLNLTEKGLYLYFLSNTLTNIAGIYKISVSRVLFDTKLTESEYKTIFSKFEEAGKAYRYKEYVLIPKWPKHQKWETHGKIKAGIEAIIKALPNEILCFAKKIGYTYPIDSLCIPYLTQAQDENDKILSSNYSDTDPDTDTNFDPNKNSDHKNFSLSGELNPSFGDFSQRLEKLRSTYNDLKIGPPFKKTALNLNPTESSDLMKIMDVYDDAVFVNAMENYKKVKESAEYDPGMCVYHGFVSFMVRGTEKFCNEANPFELFRKKDVGKTGPPTGKLDGKKSLGGLGSWR